MPVSVKTCGLSDRPAVDAALTGGARFLGFVFFPPSPRDVAPSRAAALSAGLPDGIATVGVMVEPDDDFLDAILSEMRLDYIQLHGNESPARAEDVRARTGCPHHQGDQRVPSLRHCPCRRLRPKRRPDPVRRQGNGR